LANVRAPDYDVAHIHLSRDLVTVPFARNWCSSGKPFVLQTHGMVTPDSRLRSRLFDRLLMGGILQQAAATFALTQDERESLISLGIPAAKVHMLRNGISPTGTRATWDGQLRPQILYMGRLTQRKRPEAMAGIASHLHSAGVTAATRIVGPDHGALGALQSALNACPPAVDIRYEGAVAPADAASRMRNAQVFVLPSYDEPYPMALLEAMALGIPCVITDRTGLSEELGDATGVIVTDGSVESMSFAVQEFLRSTEAWAKASAANIELIRDRYDSTSVAAELERHYFASLST
jgi:glycosyltransferase involved in cell wall biosynthesis